METRKQGSALQVKEIHWPSLLIFAFNGLSIGFLLIIAMTLSLIALVDLTNEMISDATARLMTAGGIITGAILLIPGAYFGLCRLLNFTDEKIVNIRLTPMNVLIFVVLWPAAIVGGYFVGQTSFAIILMPIVGILGAGLPIWFLVQLALHGLPLGRQFRAWGIFSLGLTVGPLIILIVETVSMLVAFIGAAVIIAMNPDMLRELQSVMERLALVNNADEVFQLLGPYIFTPVMIFLGLTAISIVVPIIEELLKTVSMWFAGNRILGTTDGYIMGILCGAGYAFFESMGIGPGSGASWAMVSFARFGTDVVHVLNGGLMGWALVSAWRERRYVQLAAIYAVAILLHGFWNALSILIGLSQAANGFAGLPAWLPRLLPVSSLGLGVLTALMVITLWTSNRLMRRVETEKQV
jgi:hypothetical protein